MAIIGGDPDTIIVQPSVIGFALPLESLAMAIITCSGYLVLIASVYSTFFLHSRTPKLNFYVYLKSIFDMILALLTIYTRRNV